MAITVTGKAAKHIKKVLAKEGGLGLRVGVKEVGCSGLTYTFDYLKEAREKDETFISNDVTVVVREDHLPFLNGAVLDFERKGLNEVFKVENPNAAATCGCGESFTIVEPV